MVALGLPSREGTTVAQKVEIECRSVVVAAGGGGGGVVLCSVDGGG